MARVALEDWQEQIRDPKIECMSRDEMTALQSERLVRQVKNVYENVAFALEIFGLPKDEIHEKVLKVLDLVGLKHKSKNYPNELSGGEQQRVAIARSIVNGPKLLICDEPTGNLDEDTSMEIMEVLDQINKLGTTIIMVTHDIEIVKRMNKRVVLLDSGRVLRDYEEGTYTHEGIKNFK